MIAPIPPTYIKAEDYWDLIKDHDYSRFDSLKEVERAAELENELCENCGEFDIWKLAGTGMCFVCTTGETDASEDYELI